jgi:hypothetical protein
VRPPLACLVVVRHLLHAPLRALAWIPMVVHSMNPGTAGL